MKGESIRGIAGVGLDGFDSVDLDGVDFGVDFGIGFDSTGFGSVGFDGDSLDSEWEGMH